MKGLPVSPFGQTDESALLEEIDRFLASGAHQDNPLRDLLVRLLTLHRQQNERLLRLIHLSDGYHDLGRMQSASLAQRLERHLRRLEKLARISDRYQDQLRSLNDALLKSSLKDPLTELGNRRYLMERLGDGHFPANNPTEPCCIAMLDVDHFKRINDGWGHEIGDETLKHIASALRETIRHSDIIGRWGGEEFLLIFPATELAEALVIAERIRQAIMAISIAHPLGPVAVSASIGLTLRRHDEPLTITLNRADEALLQAKRTGRNRTVTD